MTPIDTGYDSQPTNEEPMEVRFELEQYKHQYAMSGAYARILRNGEPVGMVRLADEREFDFLKGRIDGTLESEG